MIEVFVVFGLFCLLAIVAASVTVSAPRPQPARRRACWAA